MTHGVLNEEVVGCISLDVDNSPAVKLLQDINEQRCFRDDAPYSAHCKVAGACHSFQDHFRLRVEISLERMDRELLAEVIEDLSALLYRTLLKEVKDVVFSCHRPCEIQLRRPTRPDKP